VLLLTGLLPSVTVLLVSLGGQPSASADPRLAGDVLNGRASEASTGRDACYTGSEGDASDCEVH
jgi:hypothetical protein